MRQAAFVQALAIAGVVSFGALIAIPAASAGEVAAKKYFPEYAPLQKASATGLKVCVLGFSAQNTGVSSGVSTFNVPAYYLGKSAPTDPVAWRLATSAPGGVVRAWEVGVDIKSLPLQPVSPPATAGIYINAANVTFFLTPPSVDCATISYTFSNVSTGQIATSYQPYPSGLVEFSTYPKPDASAAKYSDVITVDTSNVDSFETPLLVRFAGMKNSVLTYIASFGNPIGLPAMTRKSLISGPKEEGGATSPFWEWIKAQQGCASVSRQFLPLALSKSTPAPLTACGQSLTLPQFEYAMLQSPNDYLASQCLVIPDPANPGKTKAIPRGCGLNGDFINLKSPLNSYFDAELSRFFNDAFVVGRAAQLRVMGDSQPGFTQGAWEAFGRASCPVYLKPVYRSINFRQSVGGPTITLCNPVGQVIPFAGQITAAQIKRINAPVGKIQTMTITLTKTQCDQIAPHMGKNFGQPSSGFVGVVTAPACSANNNIATLTVLDGKGGSIANNRPYQHHCSTTSDAKGNPVYCPSPNPSFADWVISNVAWLTPATGATKWFETPSQMVFGNDGAFNSWQALYYSGKDAKGNTVVTPQGVVAQSLARNVVAAFTRGIANCNNLTMNRHAAKPYYCGKITSLPTAGFPSPAPSDVYWSNEKNFYPAGGYQNYYAQYLHTKQLWANGAKTNIFVAPQPRTNPGGPIPAYAFSNQNIVMGMAYGFGFDENPSYAKVAQVPSKLDPVPASWWDEFSAVRLMTIVVGNAN